jgi:hypothetical protein
LTVGKLERVVVHIRLVLVDLAKASDLVPEPIADTKGDLADQFPIKGKLCSREQADRNVGIIDCSEAASPRVDESSRNELVTDPRGS